jgi:large subunit ribosomal protein L25
MELQPFTANTRDSKGKGAARQSRMGGNIPGVLYGDGKNTVSLTINEKDFDRLIHGGQGSHSLVDLTIENDADHNTAAIVKDVQHHPVRGHVMHADFMRIDIKKPIQTPIPIKLEGYARGVVDGGVLDHQLREIMVECLPLDTPEHVVIDITNMEIDDSIHVRDLTIDDHIKVLTELDRSVAAIHTPRVIEEVTDVEAAIEGEGEGEGEGETTESTEDGEKSSSED